MEYCFPDGVPSPQKHKIKTILTFLSFSCSKSENKIEVCFSLYSLSNPIQTY